MTPKMLAEKVSTLFSLPDVAIRVNELLDETETTNADLEEVILHDPALTAKLLKIVNSAYFGFPGKIDTISKAISMIGHKELRNLVLATTVTDCFKDIPEHLVDMDTFWYHSITSAVLARLLAKKCDRIDLERFFISGLLNSIGKLIFFTEFPQQSAVILDLKDQGQQAMYEKEREIFSFTYAELGTELLKQWKLPITIWSMINYHLNPFNATDSIDDACILHVAAHIAAKIEPCAKHEMDFQELELNHDSQAFKYLKLQKEDYTPLIQEASFQAFDILGFIKPSATVIY